MQHLEVSCAVRPIEWPLGVKWLSSVSKSHSCCPICVKFYKRDLHKIISKSYGNLKFKFIFLNPVCYRKWTLYILASITTIYRLIV